MNDRVDRIIVGVAIFVGWCLIAVVFGALAFS